MNNGSSHKSCSLQKSVIKNLSKFTGKHLCMGLFFNKVAGLRVATLLKKRLWHRCFPLKFAKFSKTPFLQNTSGRLLLEYCRNTLDKVKLLVIHSLKLHQLLQPAVVNCFLYFGSNIHFQLPKMTSTLTQLVWTEFFVLTQSHAIFTMNRWIILLSYFRVT